MIIASLWTCSHDLWIKAHVFQAQSVFCHLFCGPEHLNFILQVNNSEPCIQRFVSSTNFLAMRSVFRKSSRSKFFGSVRRGRAETRASSDCKASKSCAAHSDARAEPSTSGSADHRPQEFEDVRLTPCGVGECELWEVLHVHMVQHERQHFCRQVVDRERLALRRRRHGWLQRCKWRG